MHAARVFVGGCLRNMSSDGLTACVNGIVAACLCCGLVSVNDAECVIFFYLAVVGKDLVVESRCK